MPCFRLAKFSATNLLGLRGGGAFTVRRDRAPMVAPMSGSIFTSLELLLLELTSLCSLSHLTIHYIRQRHWYKARRGRDEERLDNQNPGLVTNTSFHLSRRKNAGPFSPTETRPVEGSTDCKKKRTTTEQLLRPPLPPSPPAHAAPLAPQSRWSPDLWGGCERRSTSGIDASTILHTAGQCVILVRRPMSRSPPHRSDFETASSVPSRAVGPAAG